MKTSVGDVESHVQKRQMDSVRSPKCRARLPYRREQCFGNGTGGVRKSTPVGRESLENS